jgi:peptide chain release factor 1
MKMLYAKLWEKAETERKNEIDSTRKEQVKTGDRSEKIRTYNYPQNRVTDHRINLSLNKLDYIMQGYLDEIIEGLIENEQVELLNNLNI